MHAKNSTTQEVTQQRLTAEIGFCDAPIDNRGVMIFNVAGGTNTEDALETAKVLSSGLHQICNHLHDSLNMGEMAYCDGVKALGFLAETVSALIWSVQRSANAAADVGAKQ
ncbi:hypothetical protein N015_08345 [Pseudomonas asturiensis]|uniref:DUF3077 domain-containing protein n=1 Tax=Pseudomonas asturiensis TaxID=1190415 RepID=A0ABX6HAL3_9PSED|nr:hypothetical protein [Pseudomonas asturiensis]QHF02419.1 hypothetical protein N015_08345 [Pseudomonas asturiensis]